MQHESLDRADVAIVGAGIAGSSVAYFLSRHPAMAGRRIVLIERDLGFAQSSTGRSAGGLRQQFSTPENIALSQATLAMIRSIKETFGATADLGFKEHGYLLLASAAGAAILADNVRLQKRYGAETALLDVPALARTFDWLSTDGLASGAFGVRGEGWFDPPTFAALLREGARRAGVALVSGEVAGIDLAAGRVAGVRLADGRRMACGQLVDAAGAWSGQVARLAGVHLPVEPRKRFIYVVDCRDAGESLRRAPLTVDPEGVWFRPEGRTFLCGKSPEEHSEPSLGDLEDIDQTFFEAEIWPHLARRVPVFESVKVVGAWAGYYDYNTFDQNAVLGPHPELGNLHFLAGFSGHGAQQAPAAGRALAELIAEGRFTTLDLGRLGYARIAADRPLLERNVI